MSDRRKHEQSDGNRIACARSSSIAFARDTIRTGTQHCGFARRAPVTNPVQDKSIIGRMPVGCCGDPQMNLGREA